MLRPFSAPFRLEKKKKKGVFSSFPGRKAPEPTATPERVVAEQDPAMDPALVWIPPVTKEREEGPTQRWFI